MVALGTMVLIVLACLKEATWEIIWFILIRDIANKSKSASKLHDGSRRGKGNRTDRGEKSFTADQLPGKEIVTRQVKTCLHLPILGSYHTIYLSDFPTCKTKKKPPLWSTYLLTSIKKLLLEWGQFNFLPSPFDSIKILKTFSKLTFTSI